MLASTKERLRQIYIGCIAIGAVGVVDQLGVDEIKAKNSFIVYFNVVLSVYASVLVNRVVDKYNI